MIALLLCLSLIALAGIEAQQNVGQSESDKLSFNRFAAIELDSESLRDHFVSSADLSWHIKRPSNVSSSSDGASLMAVSDAEWKAGMTKLLSLRRSAGASNMMHVCWETKLAYYAQYMVTQCSDDSLLPGDFDDVNYVPERIMIFSIMTTQRLSLADTVSYLHDAGGTRNKLVMQYDLTAMGCGQTFCSIYQTTPNNLRNVYVNTCLFHYRSEFNSTGLPFTPGPACSMCPDGTLCNDKLCRDFSSYLPALNCHLPSSSTSTLWTSILQTVISTSVALSIAMRIVR